MLKKFVMTGIFLLGASQLALAADGQIKLAVEFERNAPVGGGIHHVQRSEKEVLLDFNKQAVITLEGGWVLEVQSKDSGDAVDLTMTVRESAQAQAKVLARPHLLAKLGQSSTVRWTDGEEKIALVFKPARSKS